MIERPLEALNAQAGPDAHAEIETPVTEAVLRDVSSGALSQASDSAPGERVDTSALQLVLTRLWDVEVQNGSTVLRLRTLEELGGPTRILGSFVDDAMATLSPNEQDVAAQVLRFVITPSGTKVAQSAEDLAAYTELPVERVRAVLERLSSGSVRVLRPVAPRAGTAETVAWEIFHDLIGVAAREWAAEREMRRSRQRGATSPGRRRARSAAGRARVPRRLAHRPGDVEELRT